jgi:hypothetical protein
MTVHHPAFLQLFQGSDTFLAVQNYYLTGSVLADGVEYQFLDFSASGMTSSTNADSSTTQVTLPALTTVILQTEQALAQGWLARLRIYRFEADAGPTSPPSGQTTMVDIIGEVTGAASPSDAIMTLEIGSALAPIGAQIPPRRFTSALVGVPARL